MNLYVTHPDPNLCAMALDDRRVLICCRISSIIFRMASPFKELYPHKPPLIAIDHITVAWAKQNDRNLSWILDFHISLAAELTYRFPNKPIDKSFMRFGYEYSGLLRSPGKPHNFINHTTVGGIDLSSLEVHYAYRSYLRYLWATDKFNPTWSFRPPPVWLVEDIPDEVAHYPHIRSSDISWKKSGEWVRVVEPHEWNEWRLY